MTRAPVELTLGLPSYAAEDPGSWQHLFDLAKAADAAGVDRLTVSDHVVFGERLDEYAKPGLGGQAGGRQPTGPDGHWLEPMTTLSVVAGMTSRIRLRTNILVAALRRPAVLAKAAATLDVLSGGRLDLGVGVGWQREEYDAAGLGFEGRGRLLDHSLEVCQVLWRQQRAEYSSPELAFRAIHQMPKPLQPGGVPVWVSGTINPAVVRRLGRFGVGWIRWGPDAADPGAVTRMKQALVDAGYDVPDLRVTGRLPQVVGATGETDLAASMSGLRDLVAAGVTDVTVTPDLGPDPTEWPGRLTELVSAFRGAVDRPLPSDPSPAAAGGHTES